MTELPEDYKDGTNRVPVNPLANLVPWHQQVYSRFKLLPWWLSYHRGNTTEAVLRDKIIELGTRLGLNEKWLKKIIRHAVSEFSKKGLGADYYGYHNIDHELEAAYFSLLAATNQNSAMKFSLQDTYYLFVAALFHDYDPLKEFDKPHEDSVEHFIRNDVKIREFVHDAGLNLDIVIAIIHRTAYPFKDAIAEHARKRMHTLFTNAGISDADTVTRKRYEDLGWFLSVAERVAGYALGGFEHSKDLARRNAHALGWHPSVINERSVKFFDFLEGEKEMFDKVMRGVPQEYRNTFYENVDSFRDHWVMEQELRNLVKKHLMIMSVVEKCGLNLEPYIQESVFRIFKEQLIPVPVEEEIFRKSLYADDSILVTLRINDKVGDIIGYAKGGPLEKYTLRRGTYDHNNGKGTTAYLEGISIRQGYWGESGGHLLRMQFLNEAIKHGYRLVTGYAHRKVVYQRIKKGECIEIVQKYDPDKLDYYRADLSNPVYQVTASESSSTMYVGS
jgi:hypothetical protein